MNTKYLLLKGKAATEGARRWADGRLHKKEGNKWVIVKEESGTPKEKKPTSKKKPVLDTSQFESHLANQKLTDAQKKTALGVYKKLRDGSSVDDLNKRMENLKKLPPSKGKPGIAAIEFLLTGSQSEPVPVEHKELEQAGGTSAFSMKPFSEIKRIMQYTAEKNFDMEKVKQYAQSIKDHGYDPAMPMVIDTDKKTGAFNVVAGNHRYKAVEKLIADGVLPKDFKIPTIMKTFENDAKRTAYQMKENMRRDPLATDEAMGMKKMLDAGMSHEEIAKELSLPIGNIKKRLGLANLANDLFLLVEKKDRALPVGIAEAIGMNAVDDDGKPNHTIQLKAYQFYRDNKGKGYGAGEVLSFIRELKSNASQKFFEGEGKSDTEKEALRSVGSEEKAKRNVKLLDTTFKTMQQALTRLMGDTIGQINPKLAKELSASIVAAQGESEFANKMSMLDTVIRDMQIMKEAFTKEFRGLKDDSTMGMMFASSMRDEIIQLVKKNRAAKTLKGINKMITIANKAKYKLHDNSVKARLAA